MQCSTTNRDWFDFILVAVGGPHYVWEIKVGFGVQDCKERIGRQENMHIDFC